MGTLDLDHCPFCGGEVEFNSINISGASEDCIACTVCDCVFTIAKPLPTKRELAFAWNGRVRDECETQGDDDSGDPKH